MINHVVLEEQLDAKVAEIANKILSNPRWAVRWTKSTVNITLREIAVKVMDAGLAYELISNTLEDRKEAIAAFKEKRPAKFSGE